MGGGLSATERLLSCKPSPQRSPVRKYLQLRKIDQVCEIVMHTFIYREVRLRYCLYVVVNIGLVEEKSEWELMEEESKEQRLRLEASMKMREIYVEKQKRWQEFREAERQRRVDKAAQEELDRLAGILARSRARREYSHAKFQQMATIRSYYDAAVVIQRTFRRMKSMRSHLREQALKEEAQRRKMANKAAHIIQKAWRRYKQYKLYQAMHFKSIMTGPVIALPARPKVPSPPYGQVKGIPSYERAIFITG